MEGQPDNAISRKTVPADGVTRGHSVAGKAIGGRAAESLPMRISSVVMISDRDLLNLWPILLGTIVLGIAISLVS